MKMTSTTQPKLRAIVIGVGLKSDDAEEIRESLAELVELTEASQKEVVGVHIQFLEQWNPATLLGTGKVDEIFNTIEETKATHVIVDEKLSGVQARNLQNTWKITTLDRTQLILEIFAQRAQTHEGKLQVQLAQLLDLKTRMVGAWMGSLSRQGGGIGTLGPGERALELDRRNIRDKILQIRKDLESVRQHREQHRASRKKLQIPSFALVGYTNVGKSTLLNLLTKSNVLVKDQVFATLDPTTRKIFLENAPHSVVTDTVGFLRKLPTHLVEAFKATLEESEASDILIHVVDISHSQWKRQMEVVEGLIHEFGWQDKPMITVFNKMDKASPERKFQIKSSMGSRVFTSATTGEGIDQLKGLMRDALLNLEEEVELFFPLLDRHRIFELGREARILRQEDGTQGTVCFARMAPRLKAKWTAYIS